MLYLSVIMGKHFILILVNIALAKSKIKISIAEKLTRLGIRFVGAHDAGTAYMADCIPGW